MLFTKFCIEDATERPASFRAEGPTGSDESPTFASITPISGVRRHRAAEARTDRAGSLFALVRRVP